MAKSIQPRRLFCCYGQCLTNNLDVAVNRSNGVSLFAFPQPCSKYTTKSEGIGSSIKINYEHDLLKCNECLKCQKWGRLCHRVHPYFTNLLEVSVGTYICTKHFVDPLGPTKENPDPVPAPKLNVAGLTKKRPANKVIESNSKHNKIEKLPPKVGEDLSLLDKNYIEIVEGVPSIDTTKEKNNVIQQIIKDIFPTQQNQTNTKSSNAINSPITQSNNIKCLSNRTKTNIVEMIDPSYLIADLSSSSTDVECTEVEYLDDLIGDHEVEKSSSTASVSVVEEFRNTINVLTEVDINPSNDDDDVREYLKHDINVQTKNQKKNHDRELFNSMPTLKLPLMCRICLKNRSPFIDIFTARSKTGTLYREIYTKLCNIRVSPQDGKPSSLCNRCVRILDLFDKFLQDIKYSDEILSNGLAASGRKNVGQTRRGCYYSYADKLNKRKEKHIARKKFQETASNNWLYKKAPKKSNKMLPVKCIKNSSKSQYNKTNSATKRPRGRPPIKFDHQPNTSLLNLASTANKHFIMETDTVMNSSDDCESSTHYISLNPFTSLSDNDLTDFDEAPCEDSIHQLPTKAAPDGISALRNNKTQQTTCSTEGSVWEEKVMPDLTTYPALEDVDEKPDIEYSIEIAESAWTIFEQTASVPIFTPAFDEIDIKTEIEEVDEAAHNIDIYQNKTAFKNLLDNACIKENPENI